MINKKGWELLKLGDVANIVRGSSPRPQGDPRYYHGSVPRLMIEDITRDGKFVTPLVDSLTLEGAKLSCSAES
jgi:type I restriction enzyme S subunit